MYIYCHIQFYIVLTIHYHFYIDLLGDTGILDIHGIQIVWSNTGSFGLSPGDVFIQSPVK